MKKTIMLTQPQNLRFLILIQTAVGLVLALASGVFGNLQLGASIAIGSTLMLLSVLVHGWTWYSLLAKKSIAWNVLIIVIKYAVLLGSIFYLARTEGFSVLGVGLGIASFMVATLILALINQRQEHAVNAKLIEKN